MSIENLLEKIIGHSLLYVQTGDHRHYAKAKDAEASIIKLVKSPPSEVLVVKEKKGIPTVIEWKGERFTFDSQSTFRGGVNRGKKPQSHGQGQRV